MKNWVENPAKQRLYLLAPACAALLLAGGLAGCGDDEDGDKNEVPAAEATFETYNVGLAPGFVGHAAARRDLVARELAQSSSDIICLQEVWVSQNAEGEWTEDQIDAIIAETQATLPYAYFETTEAEGTVSCSVEDAEPLKTCAFANCAGVSTDEVANCALANCSDEINALPADCKECVFGQIGNAMEDILNTCTGGGAGAYSYNGDNGLLLLSRHELKNPEFTTFESTIVQRNALHATASIPDLGEVDVYCTHLAANLSDVPYPGGTFDSYEAEQAAQIDALLAWVEQTSTTGNVVLMGDMNTGPAKGSLKAEFPEHFQTFLDAGFINPYLALDDPQCTYCGSNTLNDGDQNKAIDQVFFDFTTPFDVVSAERVHTETVNIETEAGATESTHLSDHFGVAVTIKASTP